MDNNRPVEHFENVNFIIKMELSLADPVSGLHTYVEA
jgi:hypothetical protein